MLKTYSFLLIFILLLKINPAKAVNLSLRIGFKQQPERGYFFMEKICGIYKITSPSGRIYIGQSIDCPKRFKQYKSTRANYLRDSATEAPTGAAEPVTAQSIRSRRFCSLQRVKPHTPDAGHPSNSNIPIQTNKNKINKIKLHWRFSS